jgi:hypothetical protein
MPFVLDGERGRVDICGGGALNEIEISVDRLRQRPQAELVRTTCPGSFVRVHWPVRTEPDLDAGAGLPGYLASDERRFLQVADGFAFLNPHLTLRLDWFDDEVVYEATDPGWAKWLPSSPTCPHWYRPEDLERLIAAYLVHDQDNGRDRTVREFVAEFKGLTSTVKQKQVLAATGLARSPLSALVNAAGDDVDRAKAAELLTSMRAYTTPVKPRALGEIGRAHLERSFAQLGTVEESFQYQRRYSVGDDGLPQVTETAFAALAGGDVRKLVTGVNWSAGWINPFRVLGAYGRSLDSELAAAFAGYQEPVVLLVHVAHPRVQYTDRAKSTVLTDG